MPSAEQFRIATGAGFLLLWLGFVALQARYGNVSTREYALVGLVTVFVVVSFLPAFNEHPAYPPLSLGFAAVAFGANAVRSGSGIYGIFAVLTGIGALVELYNWRTGAELLRLD